MDCHMMVAEPEKVLFVSPARYHIVETLSPSGLAISPTLAALYTVSTSKLHVRRLHSRPEFPN